MKLGRLRTLRGQITVSGGIAKTNLVVADGLINYGLRITRFTMWPADNVTPTGSNRSFTGVLSLDPISPITSMDAGTNSQFAWTFFSAAGAPTPSLQQNVREIIDPDHIVNRDLFLTMHNSTSGTYNYLVEAQVVELTDDEAIITIIKETSQS